MTKQAHKSDAVWVEIDPETLPDGAKAAYAKYKAMYRETKAQRASFEGMLNAAAPDGSRFIFGYNFGKLSMAQVEATATPVKAKQATLSLGDFLAAQQAMGRSS